LGPSAGYQQTEKKREQPCKALTAISGKPWVRFPSVSRRWGGIFDVEALCRRIDELNALAQQSGFWDDQPKAQKTLSERANLEQTVHRYERLSREASDLGELLQMAVEEHNESLTDELAAQANALGVALRELELERMLSGSEDRADAIVSISPGAGGVDAQDWAEMLMRMYLRWCERKGFKTEVVNLQPGDDAGIKDVAFTVQGAYAYGFLRAENGVHRLIRISPFDSNARRHTGFAAVFVVPNLEDDIGDIIIKPEDLRVDTYRSGGAGGQHINKTESAIRLTHLPSGIVVACQNERSQHKNRSTAMKMLRGRLYEKARQEREAAFERNYASGKMAISFGSQVRTYTLAPYRLAKDERTEYKTGNVDAVLDGELDAFIEAYLLKASGAKLVNPEAVDPEP
jgi:peptide chain release factor 2